MKLDFKSLAFGYKLIDGVSTPAWETSLGQGAGYKINNSETIDELVKGMIYKSVMPKKISFKKGRGGTVVKGDAENASLVSAAVFDKVYINEHKIENGKFILLVVKDDSESHKGRLKLKYGLDNAYEQGDGTVITNRDFQNIAATQLGLAADACWFVYDISVENQDLLRLSAVIVNKNGSESYANSAALHSAWDSLIEADVGSASSELSIDDLAAILEKMYNNPATSGKAMTPMIFGFQHAEIIEKNKYSLSAIVAKTSVPNSYEVEIKKGINTYNAIKNGEYGLDFTFDASNEVPANITINYNTNVITPYSHNRIIFGAPGTGKSFTLNKEMKMLVSNDESFERVTFHPDYSYANFVGTYKPVPDGNGITYSFVAGPFIRTWIKAIKGAQNYIVQPYVLLIEEINRANVAAVFGDVFQLLDRDENGVSEYSIQTSKELREYLAAELNCAVEDVASIKIPNNMFIWATMNSADQGVFPMDTAFKRRWDFKYLGIDDSQNGIETYELKIAGQTINWNKLRQAINDRLSALNINEDKLIGPYFINEKTLKDNATFVEAFKSKVLMYLFEDAAKQRRGKVFYQDGLKYSDLCKKFDDDGIKVFSSEIYKNLINTEETE